MDKVFLLRTNLGTNKNEWREIPSAISVQTGISLFIRTAQLMQDRRQCLHTTAGTTDSLTSNLKHLVGVWQSKYNKMVLQLDGFKRPIHWGTKVCS